jgi:hypothetical protein
MGKTNAARDYAISFGRGISFESGIFSFFSNTKRFDPDFRDSDPIMPEVRKMGNLRILSVVPRIPASLNL